MRRWVPPPVWSAFRKYPSHTLLDARAQWHHMRRAPFQSGHSLMLKSSRRSALEALESRIAPAAFYVSGASLEIDNAAGVAQPGDTDAASAGATHALLLHAGDRLYFNPDGVVATHATDRIWVSVTAGNALVFFKDFNGDQRFSLDELSGLAVGDRFSGSVFSDIHGSVATMLDRDGQFTPDALQYSSISRLTVSGALVSATDGYTNILAGSGIANLIVRGQSLPDGLSVNGIVATGTQAAVSSWGFGGASHQLGLANFEPAPTSRGGDIINAHFSGGLRGILTGDGQASDVGYGIAGAGGSIINVTMGISPEGFQLAAGSGGFAPVDTHASGGAGGSIIGFRGAWHSSVASAVEIYSGSGGGGHGLGAIGGAAGSIINSSFRVLDAAKEVYLRTGEGGGGYALASGGHGGNIVNSSLILQGDLGTTVQAGGVARVSGGGLYINLGSGGSVDGESLPRHGAPTAGAGGNWDWFASTKNPALRQALSLGTNAAITTQGLASFQLSAGNAGSAGRDLGNYTADGVGFGGAAGSVLGGRFEFHGQVGILGEGGVSVTGGEGGGGYYGATAGGRVEGAVFSFFGPLQLAHGGFGISGGTGGVLTAPRAHLLGGGDGGALKRVVVDFHDTVESGYGFAFRGGRGGLTFGETGPAGDGGAIDGLSILSTNPLAGQLIVASGPGGDAIPYGRHSASGAGGHVSNLLIQAPALNSLVLGSGFGGMNGAPGPGGRGGNVSTGLGFVPHPEVDAALAARLHKPAGVYISGELGFLVVDLGAGGQGGESFNDVELRGGPGGNGGSLLNSRFELGRVAELLAVAGGAGGTGKLRGAGGRSGGIDHVSFKVAGDVGGSVFIGLDPGGQAEEVASTGAGGNYSYLSVAIAGNVGGIVSIHAPNAGDLGTLVGGAGGSIDHLHLDVGDIRGADLPPSDLNVNPGRYGLQIIAGRGQGAAKGGAGGSITNSFIATKALTGGALIVAGKGGDSDLFDAAPGGALTDNHLDFRGDIGGNLEVRAGWSGSSQGRGAGARGGSITSTDITLQGALDVSVSAGYSNVSRGVAAMGGAIDGLTLENNGPVRNLAIEAGAGTTTVFGFAKGGTGGAIVGSTYANRGGAASVSVVAGGGGTHIGDAPQTRGDAGSGGALVDFTFNNAAPLVAAFFHGGPGGSAQIDGEGATGNGGAGGWVTGFMLRDSAGPDSQTHVTGGYAGDGVGITGKGGAGGSVVGTRLDTVATVDVIGSSGGEVRSPNSASVGGSGGSVRGITGRVGELTVVGGFGNSGHIGGAGGHVYGVTLSEVTRFVRMIQAGNGGDGDISGRGGSIARIHVPGDIGDFHSAFGTGPAAMGGLVAGQGGTGANFSLGVAGNVSFVTANRIAAIFAGGGAIDGTFGVNAISEVRAGEIGAETHLPGNVSVPGLRGYDTYTYNSSGGNDTPIDGPVVVREHGFNASSLSVVPLFVILAPG
jgi:hypothetical protein